MHVLVMNDTNLASDKPTSQSSLHDRHSSPSFAVDGLDSTRSCTNSDVHPWWSVDLGETYDVGRVTVTNDQHAGAYIFNF